MTKTDKLLAELNALDGLNYPDIGYRYFADISGWGGKSVKSVFVITNENGGVSYCHLLNEKSAKARCQAIERYIKLRKAYLAATEPS